MNQAGAHTKSVSAFTTFEIYLPTYQGYACFINAAKEPRKFQQDGPLKHHIRTAPYFKHHTVKANADENTSSIIPLNDLEELQRQTDKSVAIHNEAENKRGPQRFLGLGFRW